MVILNLKKKVEEKLKLNKMKKNLEQLFIRPHGLSSYIRLAKFVFLQTYSAEALGTEKNNNHASRKDD